MAILAISEKHIYHFFNLVHTHRGVNTKYLCQGKVVSVKDLLLLLRCLLCKPCCRSLITNNPSIVEWPSLGISLD